MPTLKESSALAVLRIATGALVFPHGVRKLMTGPVASIGKSLAAHGFPPWFAYVITLGELTGALLALGLYTRLSAATVAMTMWGVVVFVQLPLIRELGTGRGVVLEYPLLLALSATLCALVPSTKWSVGRRH